MEPMMNERNLFLFLIDLPTEQRASYMNEACQSDPALRERLEALLRSHEEAGSFLAKPIITSEPHLDADATEAFIPEEATSKQVPEKSDDDLTFLSPPRRSDSLGRIGHYEVLQVLGKGGFGIVFRAFDEVLQRVVAVKVMAPQIATTSPARKRFLREARSSAAVRHENVVQVYEVVEQPLPYLVMEFIPGETLQDHLNRTGPLDIKETLRIGRQIAEGLAAAHATDLIHRDIKPGNVLIEGGPQKKVKITDFGLARAADDASISQSGIIAGTPMYMAPEQAKGETLDQRADLFSLGSVLYQMAAGRPPFRANSTVAVLKRVAEETPRAIREIIPETPQWLCDIISKLHAKNPDERYQSAREVADVLTDCEAQLTANSKLKDFSRIPRRKQPAVKSSGAWKWAAGVLLPVLALVATESAGVTHLFQWNRPAAIDPGKSVGDPKLVVAVKPESPAPDDKTRLQGRWRMVAMEQNGKPVPVGEHVFGYRVENIGDTSATYGSDGKPLYAPFTLNPDADPKEFNVLTRSQGPIRHIYRFEGDKLIFALGGPGRPRPTGFTTTPDTSFSVATYVRDVGPITPAHTNTIGMEFVKVPKGKSWLGGGKDKLGEKEVEIPADFYFGKYEVTQEEWEKVMGENPSWFSRDGKGKDAVKDVFDADLKRFPVEYVSWDQCQLFVAKLNKLEKETDWVYRLPSAVEWEYACRGGPMADKANSDFDFYFAKPTHTLLPGQANFGLDGGTGRPCKVGSYEPNPLGLYDVHGNVWEWCQDSRKEPDGSPGRVYRGGGWRSDSRPCRAGLSSGNVSSLGSYLVGLRLARVPAGAPSPEAKTPLAAVAPFTDADVQRIAALPAAGQVEEVRKELKRLNPGFDGKIEPTIKNNVVTGLKFNTNNVDNVAPVRALKGLVSLDCGGTKEVKRKLSDLSPLKGMALTSLNLECTDVTDLSPLKGMPLKSLNLWHVINVADLTPLEGMPLETLTMWNNPVKDLSPLKGMPLVVFWCITVPVDDLTPLKDMKLTFLDIRSTAVTDLSPLKGMPLQRLDLGGTKTSDLTPLKGMPLRDLSFWGTQIQDLTPLQGMPLKTLRISDASVTDLSPLKGMQLEDIRLTPKNITQGLDILRSMKSLKTIGIHYFPEKIWPAAEFWERYDKGEFKE
jgi:uncharacterized protein (TIGR03067 family)